MERDDGPQSEAARIVSPEVAMVLLMWELNMSSSDALIRVMRALEKETSHATVR